MPHVGATGGGSLPFYVAASDATDEEKAAAPYLCDGAADQTEINQAFLDAADAGYGGRVLLSSGTFTLSANIQVGFGASLTGVGLATEIAAPGISTGIATYGEATLRDFRITGNFTLNSIGIQPGAPDDVIENVHVVAFHDGIGINANVQRVRVAGCRVIDCTRSIVVSSAADVRISDCRLDSELYINGTRTLVFDNHIGSGYITVAGGSRNSFAGNYVNGGLADFSDAGTNTQRGTNFSDGGTW